jgi:hypothetical protein
VNNLVYIADTSNNVIRVVDRSTNIITTFAGTPGKSGYAGDGKVQSSCQLTSIGVLATNATLWVPLRVTVDNANNLVYIADSSNFVIRVVNCTSNIISLFAGKPSVSNPLGDGGQATATGFKSISDIVVDSVRNKVYFSDYANNLIKVVDRSTGIVTTFAGGASSGSGLSKLSTSKPN